MLDGELCDFIFSRNLRCEVHIARAKIEKRRSKDRARKVKEMRDNTVEELRQLKRRMKKTEGPEKELKLNWPGPTRSCEPP